MLIWNIRGLNKPPRQREVKKHLLHNKANFVGLVETKVRLAEEKIMASIAIHGELVTNAHLSRKSRIWMLWDLELVDLQVIHIHP